RGGISGALGGHVVEGGDGEDVGRLLELAGHAVAGGGDARRLEPVAVGVEAVEEDVVVLAGEAARAAAAEAVTPDEVIDEAVRPKQLIEQEAGVVAGAPVDVQEDAGRGREGGAGGHER